MFQPCFAVKSLTTSSSRRTDLRSRGRPSNQRQINDLIIALLTAFAIALSVVGLKKSRKIQNFDLWTALAGLNFKSGRFCRDRFANLSDARHFSLVNGVPMSNTVDCLLQSAGVIVVAFAFARVPNFYLHQR